MSGNAALGRPGPARVSFAPEETKQEMSPNKIFMLRRGRWTPPPFVAARHPIRSDDDRRNATVVPD